MELVILKFSLVKFHLRILEIPLETKPALLAFQEHSLVYSITRSFEFTVALEVTFVEFPCIGLFFWVPGILLGENKDSLSVIFVIEEVSCVGVPLIVSELS